jgi:hypothetical protein
LQVNHQHNLKTNFAPEKIVLAFLDCISSSKAMFLAENLQMRVNGEYGDQICHSAVDLWRLFTCVFLQPPWRGWREKCGV